MENTSLITPENFAIVLVTVHGGFWALPKYKKIMFNNKNSNTSELSEDFTSPINCTLIKSVKMNVCNILNEGDVTNFMGNNLEGNKGLLSICKEFEKKNNRV